MLVVAGDISGGSETQFHRRLIAIADERFDTHIERLKPKREAIIVGRTATTKIAGLPAERQERIHSRAKELIVEELTLQQLRKARNKTQVAVARKLNIGQDTVSRYERQADLLLSTLQRYVEAVEGKLSLVVEFPDRKSIKIAGFGELSDDPPQRA